MKFCKGNKIAYFQDFHACRGLPHDVEFEVSRFKHPSSEIYVLRGPGHGGIPYGCGTIHVRVRFVEKSVKRRLRAAALAAKEK